MGLPWLTWVCFPSLAAQASAPPVGSLLWLHLDRTARAPSVAGVPGKACKRPVYPSGPPSSVQVSKPQLGEAR